MTLVGLAAVSVSFLDTDPSGASTSTLPTMEMVDVHDWAAAQPTATGRQIVELEVHDGKVWAGYGDYGANTGPITMAAYDPASSGGFTDEFMVDTEAIYNLKTIDGEIFAPATDPRSAADFAFGTPWAEERPLRAAHVYDTVTLTGSDQWMVGSKGPDAVAWRSTDGGATWQEELRVPPTSGRSDDFMRFYFAGVLDERLYVQAVSRHYGPVDSSNVFDGTNWSAGPTLLPDGGVGWSPEPFNGGLVYHMNGHGYSGGIYFFDGHTARFVEQGYDIEIVQDTAWLLDDSGSIKQSTDLAIWSDVALAPTSARSLAVSATDLYVGTTDSELWTAGGVDVASTSTRISDVTQDQESDSTPARGSSAAVNQHGHQPDRRIGPHESKNHSSPGPQETADPCRPGHLRRGLC